MAVLDCNHPDLLEFIEAKHTKGRWNNFNVSVGVTDEFMRAVEQDQPWQLVHRAEPSPALRSAGDVRQREDGLWVYSERPAREIWDRIMRSTYDVAEPGIVFISRMNEDNNLRAVETIRATNPCGEQPLPAYGCCNLGPLNLTRFVVDPFAQMQGRQPSFDWDGLAQRTRTQVRFLDNVLDVTLWPLPQQYEESRAKRRIGVGFTGLGDTLVMLGLRYDSQEGRFFAVRIAQLMRDEAYRASVDLAKERGAFALFDAERYLEDRHLRLAICPMTSRTRYVPGRHPQQPLAVDRADGHREPRVRRQRIERHRAGNFSVDLHAHEGDGRRRPRIVRLMSKTTRIACIASSAAM